ncbi:methionyl-tRNA formyltransferase [Brevibacillus sp. B_LB10_24]|uniref:methionyl-tRNA formyltransferase n=1 Tax=Brevibacillus sp. B_LB10_24 TaxID=3380645 RepID=UPI0038BAE57D
MKIAFMGCVEFSFVTFEHLLSMSKKDSRIEIVGVVTRQESQINSDFRSLEPLAVDHNIPCFIAQKNNQSEISEWLQKLQPEVIYCFGWSYLLRDEILSIPKMGVIGYHPSELPKNRGRHPIIWALALGLPRTGSTFFFMDKEADTGDILNQKLVSIQPSDDASTLYSKLIDVATGQISEFTYQLLEKTYSRTRQETKANHWRKRTKIDGEIDWRMTAEAIHNLVRALTKPYVGAHCLLQGEEIKIWRTEVLEVSNDNLINIEPGKILKIDNEILYVKCGSGVLKIVEHEFKKIPREGDYL